MEFSITGGGGLPYFHNFFFGKNIIFLHENQMMLRMPWFIQKCSKIFEKYWGGGGKVKGQNFRICRIHQTFWIADTELSLISDFALCFLYYHMILFKNIYPNLYVLEKKIQLRKLILYICFGYGILNSISYFLNL